MEEHIVLSQTEEVELEAESLGEKIELIIQKLPPHEVTLTEILDIVGVDSLMLLTIFMSLIFLVPVSIPGVSTVFGMAILLIGVTHLFARKLWLPGFVAHRKLSALKLREGFGRALVWIHRLERVSRPHRMPRFTTGRVVNIFNNLAFILAALLLMTPFGFIPFSNTLPALALICLSVGMMERDGGSIVLGYLAIVATILYFGFLILGGGYSVIELVQRLQ